MSLKSTLPTMITSSCYSLYAIVLGIPSAILTIVGEQVKSGLISLLFGDSLRKMGF